MKIIYNPPSNPENKYIDVMVEGLKKAGHQVFPLDTLFSSIGHFKSIKIIHLNWFENLDDKNKLRGITSFFRKMFVLIVSKLAGKKIVWTMHNRRSHEKGLSVLSNILINCLIVWCDKLIIHSELSNELLQQHGSTIKRKILYLPHPDFVNVYGPIRDQDFSDPQPLQLLFLGAAKPYKNLEMLIQVVKSFDSSVQLTIAGNPASENYQNALFRQAKGDASVKFMLRFIDDTEIAQLIAGCDLLVFPYDLDSSLNSGSVILSFSYAKTVICPDIGTIQDLGDHLNEVLHYNYTTDEEHAVELAKRIKQAVHLKNRDSQSLKEMGQALFNYVQRVHNKDAVATMLSTMYRKLVHK